jgi:flavin-dependent dehydrogenase
MRGAEKTAMSAACRTTGHLVIGGGLAGSMLAIRLAAAGREVTLLEKERGPHHKVCGEFLSGEAVEYLRGAGAEPLALGAATIRTVRLSSGKRIVEAPLPFTALSLSRRVLDEALLARASACGCRVERGTFVKSLEAGDGMWVARLRDGESWRAQTTFLASGKHDVAGMERSATTLSDLVGFKLHWRLASAQTEAMRDAMELFLFTGGYGGLSQVENDAANLCLVVRRHELHQKGGWAALLASIKNENRHVAERLEGAMALWDRPLAIFPIPYGYFAARSDTLWRLGDQAAVIPSFTGDGMSIALHSGALAAQMYLAGRSAGDFQTTLNRHLGRGMWLSTRISKAMISGAGRSLAPAVLALLPHAMGGIARWTRIPEHALAADAAR